MTIWILLGISLALGEPPTAAGPGALLAAPQIQDGDGYTVVSWERTGDLPEGPFLVYGKIVRTKNTAERCYLNFHEDYRKHFSVEIPGRSLQRFPQPPEKMYDGQRVVVRGYLTSESGAPQMYVDEPDQILIVPDDQPDPVAFARTRYPHCVTLDDPARQRTRHDITETVRIGTYNVLNLFDEYDDPYTADEVMPPKPRAELEKVAERIRQLNADVLVLEEVENRFFLERFIQALLPDMSYEDVVLFEGNNHRGIDCAVLSRLPLGPVTSYRHVRFKGPDGKPQRFQRDLLRVRVEAPGLDFDVFAVHLKSKYGDAEASEPVRQAEATEIRKIADDMLRADAQARFVICGDFNDYWDSPSLKIIRGSGATELTCPVVELEEPQRITYNKDPYRSTIDFIVSSPAMRSRFVPGSYGVIQGTVESSGSDHNPSAATFRIK